MNDLLFSTTAAVFVTFPFAEAELIGLNLLLQDCVIELHDPLYDLEDTMDEGVCMDVSPIRKLRGSTGWNGWIEWCVYIFCVCYWRARWAISDALINSTSTTFRSRTWL